MSGLSVDCTKQSYEGFCLPIGRFGVQRRPRTLPRARFCRRKKRFKKGNTLLDDHAQQPFDVVARCAQHRVQPVAGLALEVAAVHAVIGLDVADDRFDRLAPPQLLSREQGGDQV